ncbi:hypothetical protein P1U16_23295 [Escherichia coli]
MRSRVHPGALNISLFWSLLFISVYRLPGRVAATVGAVQPLMVVFICATMLGSPIRWRSWGLFAELRAWRCWC